MQDEFSPISYKVGDTLQKILNKNGEFSCEDAFVNMLIWKDIYKYEYSLSNNQLIVRLFDNSHMLFHLPFGDDFEGGIEKILNSAKKTGQAPMIVLSSGERAKKFISLYGDMFNFTPYRDGYEYLYLTERLQTLKGKKLHSKRNHISAFSKRHEWYFEELSDQNMAAVLKVAEQWFAEKGITDKDIEFNELSALPFLLSNRESLNIQGGILVVDGKPAGYTIGSKLNDDVFVTHSEKVLGWCNDGYSVINREFARTLGNFKYINREDDLGIEGLRLSKLSYVPDILLEKFICTPK